MSAKNQTVPKICPASTDVLVYIFCTKTSGFGAAAYDSNSLSDVSFRFHQRNLKDFNYMVQAPGFGIRYKTPVGPEVLQTPPDGFGSVRR
jgi:hypothetical protein